MTNDKQQKIMERISNLLAKTVENGCTPEEAASAATMAQRLIAKYHIDMREYVESEDVGIDTDMIQKPWQQTLATTIAQNTCCDVVGTSFRGCRGTKRLTFIGRETDRLAVLQMYDRLLMVCMRGISAEKKHYKEVYGHTRGVENSYAMGFIKAVSHAMNEQCRALQLVVPESVEEKIKELFPNVKSTRPQKVKATEAYHRGYADGRSAAGRKVIAG